MFNFFKKKKSPNLVPPNSQRYYYPSKELIGEEYCSDIICEESFHRLQEKERLKYSLICEIEGSNIDETETACSMEKYAQGKDVFEVVVIREEDKEYSDKSNGVSYCYLPSVVECYDKDAPTTFFVSLIEGRCEILSNSNVLSGEDADNYLPWYKSVGKYSPVRDGKVIERIEASLIAMEKQLDEQIAKYGILLENAEKAKQERIEKNKKRLAMFSEGIEEVLLAMGVSSSACKSIIKKAVTEEDFVMEVLHILQDKGYIAYLDWKDDVEEVLFSLNIILKKKEKPLLEEKDFDLEEEVYCDEALEYIQKRAEEQSFVLIDTGSDGVYVTEVDRDEVEDFVSKAEKLFCLPEVGFSVRKA